MGRKTSRIPSYRLHKATGQAVVTLNGKDHYLGLHGTEASRSEYDRIVGQWQARGRRPADPVADGIAVKELIRVYWKYAESHYRKDGKETSQLGLIKRTLRVVKESFGDEPAAAFGPIKLKAVREKFITNGFTRSTCNEHTARIKRLFAWGVAEELIPPSVFHGLQAVKGLAKGRSAAPDNPPVGPVPPEHIEAVLPKVRPTVATMIRLQDLTGMRPGEVCLMRACDLDRSGPVWSYIPERHKTEHRGRSRTIVIGPRAQEILAPWLSKHPDGYLFRPLSFSTNQYNAKRRKGKWKPGDHYTAQGYGASIRKACRRIGVPVWTPNQLRHNAATRIRHRFGLEAAQTVLGHAQANITEIYAERDLGKAREVMSAIG